MTDKEATESFTINGLGELNSGVHTSNGDAEADIENVDAIKRYIEEQEILLRDSSSANNLLHYKTDNDIIRDNQKECEALEQQLLLSDNKLKPTDNLDDISNNKLNPESLSSVGSMLSQSQYLLSNDSSLDLDNEESLANEAAANLLSLSQNCFLRHTITKDSKYSDGINQTNMPQHEQTFNRGDIPEIENNNDNEKLEINQQESSDLNRISLSPKKSEDEQHLCIPNQVTLQKVKKIQREENSNIVEEKLKCDEKSCVESDSDTKVPVEYKYSEPPTLLQKLLTVKNTLKSEINNSDQLKNISSLQDNKEHSEETLAIATSVMDMILNDAEAAISKKKVCNALSKQLGPGKANTSVALAIGSKVEAKDFCELWHPAEIVEVDCEEMEVLVQYDNQPKKHNEWINISSPRLRPIGSLGAKSASRPATPAPEENSELKAEDKQKLTFAVGERCLARWRDNRRFIATVQHDLGNGNYEVMFDDGFQWKCTLSRMYKLKESSDVHDWVKSGACPSPPAAPAPLAASPATNGLPRLPLYHTHLFDPTRDYLGSKSERREMKRKLNIKEIFNIGQKRKKLHTAEKEAKTTAIIVKEEIKSEPTDAPTPEMTPLTIPALKDTSSAIQVKKAIKRKPPVKKKPLARKKIKLKLNTDSALSLSQPKKELPDAVASIIGTVCNAEPEILEVKLEPLEIKDSNANDIKLEEHNAPDADSSVDTNLTSENLHLDDIVKEEPELVKFDIHDGVKHEEVIGKIKEVITKLEDGINEVEKIEVEKTKNVKPEANEEVTVVDEAKPAVKQIATSEKEKSKKSSKVKKGKKLRLLQEKKVKKQVEKVKSQLEEMKKQVEEMRQQIMLKTEELASARMVAAPESCLLPGEWCCHWVDGQPLGAVSEAPADPAPAAAPAGTPPPLPRRSVQVEDKRLPPGWSKHMVRRSLGTSAGKWDVVLVSPENRRIHTKSDMRVYLENKADEGLKPYEAALMDFGIHLKLSRRMGWVTTTAEGAPPPAPPPPPPTPAPAYRPPLLKRKKLSLNRNRHRHGHDTARHKKRHPLKIKPLKPPTSFISANEEQIPSEIKLFSDPCTSEEATLDGASIKDGFVYVGSLKVQVIETLLRCPAEGCFKNFRNTMLLKMHIKHYHRELRKTMGNTPKVLDLAYARTRLTEAEMTRLKCEAQQRIIKVKLPRLSKKIEEAGPTEPEDVKVEPAPEPAAAAAAAGGATPPAREEPAPRPRDSPKLRHALAHKPRKRPRVLLPVRREPEPPASPRPAPPPAADLEPAHDQPPSVVPKLEIPDCGALDFEAEISSHTVPKLMNGKVKSEKKKKKTFAQFAKLGASEDEEWASAGADADADAGSEPDSRSSYPSCGTPDSKGAEGEPARACSPSDEHKESDALYMYTETGERIKLVRMKREEIINCHCGFREEDGLMVQCELCLCWQHALCHNIQREAEVPEKYTCSICLNPRRGRRRQRFTHDQDRLYEGLLPGPGGGRASDALRRAHELSGNLLRVADALHAVRVNTAVATTKNHPKLYLWARDWETVELSLAQEKLNSEYSDLNVIINNLGKENLPIKAEDLKEMALDIKTPLSAEVDEKNGHKENVNGSQGLLSLLGSPGGASLDLPIGEFDLEKLAKSVQAEHEHGGRATGATGVTGVTGVTGATGAAGAAPQPEAAIENSACRARLLRHLQRCHALLDQRLDSIEAQVAELESQDASLEDDETADFCPRTKQTLLMVGRDLDAMEELGIVT